MQKQHRILTVLPHAPCHNLTAWHFYSLEQYSNSAVGHILTLVTTCNCLQPASFLVLLVSWGPVITQLPVAHLICLLSWFLLMYSFMVIRSCSKVVWIYSSAFFRVLQGARICFQPTSTHECPPVPVAGLGEGWTLAAWLLMPWNLYQL